MRVSHPDIDRDALVRQHLDLVGRVVSRVAYRYPAHVDREELWNAGVLGLVEAATRYDPDAGVPFGRYAVVRVRGAIIDATRSRDWVSRSVRRKIRELDHAAAEFSTEHGRAPRDEELASSLGVELNEVRTRRAQAAASSLLYLDHVDDDERPLMDRLEDPSPDTRPDEAVERRELIGTLREAVAMLPEVHRNVVERYYMGMERLQSIASDLGVTVARVSQIRAEALAAIRTHLTSLYEGVPEVPDEAPGKRMRSAYAAALAGRSTLRDKLEAASRHGREVP